ncbi:acyl-CoA dehydratase activase [[Eubacterium] cellulosolvens]
MTEYFLGIDIGASTTKAVLIDSDKNILATSVIPSGVNFAKAAKTVRDNVLAETYIPQEKVTYVVSTGYGRNNVTFTNDTRTEINCHARGVYHYFQENCLIVDIGGQDNKVISIDASGKQLSFKMNRKCAAGTGTFLEEIANRLGVAREKLDGLARGATKDITINSYCTVFASTEILSRIREGETIENMVKGAFHSIVLRVIELGLPSNNSDTIVLTGGVVHHNPLIVELLKEKLEGNVKVPPKPQLIGALGAALVARESYTNKMNKEKKPKGKRKNN